jgi:hypothetical protein
MANGKEPVHIGTYWQAAVLIIAFLVWVIISAMNASS